MKSVDSKTVEEAKVHVLNLLNTKLNSQIVYHTKEHTIDVLENAEKIGSESGLSEEEMNQLKIAALFHDVGYIEGSKEHEVKSAAYARLFLEERNITDEIIETVEKAILSTKIPQNPESKIATVLCDADMAHLASQNYFNYCEKLRKERSHLEKKEMDENTFLFQSLEFFMSHSYKTDYGQNVLQPKKEENENDIRKKLAKHLHIKKKKQDKTSYSRGVESMFRLTARNQINLSAIADNKSNILISVNAILISVILSVLVTRFNQIPEFIVPSLLFLLTSVATIVFAILSTRPNISSGKFTKTEIAENKVNLLFFGNFYNMNLEDYEWGINQLMQNDANLYSTMVKDQFYLGKILAKKYKLLKISYNVFLGGVILSVSAFAWVALNTYFVS